MSFLHSINRGFSFPMQTTIPRAVFLGVTLALISGCSSFNKCFFDSQPAEAQSENSFDPSVNMQPQQILINGRAYSYQDEKSVSDALAELDVIRYELSQKVMAVEVPLSTYPPASGDTAHPQSIFKNGDDKETDTGETRGSDSIFR